MGRSPRDLETGVYTIPESKSGEALRLPMHSRVKEILSGLPRNGVYVFAKADGEPPWDLTHTFAAAVKRAGIHDLHFHDLRHTWASMMAMTGVDPMTIQQLGGWKTLQMVQRYAHLSPDHKRAALGRLIPGRTDTALALRALCRLRRSMWECVSDGEIWCRGGVEPPWAEARRILSREWAFQLNHSIGHLQEVSSRLL